MYHGYKVVLTDYHGRKPYVYFKNHKAKYYKGYKGKPQKFIGERHDFHNDNKKYKEHDKHDHGNHKHENGNKKH